MRLILAVALLAGIAAAFVQTCPYPTNTLYAHRDCPSFVDCEMKMCSCLGAPYLPSGKCAAGQSQCDNARYCAENFISCVNDAAASAANTTGDLCSTWGWELKNDLTAIAAGNAYVNSDADLSCRNSLCHFMNDTTPTLFMTGGQCDAYNIYELGCKKPDVPSLTVSIQGNFTELLANETTKQQLKDAAEASLKNATGQNVTVTNVREGSLIIDFYFPDIQANDTAFVANVTQQLTAASNNNVSSGTAWFQQIATVVTDNGGNASSLTTAAVAVATPAPFTPLPTTLAPPTPVPATPAPVRSPFDDLPGCGSSCIAGIVVAVVVVIIIITIVVVCVTRKKKRSTEEKNEPTYDMQNV